MHLSRKRMEVNVHKAYGQVHLIMSQKEMQCVIIYNNFDIRFAGKMGIYLYPLCVATLLLVSRLQSLNRVGFTIFTCKKGVAYGILSKVRFCNKISIF